MRWNASPTAALALALGIALAAPLSGCNKHATSAKLEGRWKGMRVDGAPPEGQNNANVFAMGTEIIARGNQIAFSTPAQKALQATYTVESEDKNTLVLRTDKDPPQTLTFSDDGRTMVWQVDDHRRMTFVKQGN
jgi:hypothetical protein